MIDINARLAMVVLFVAIFTFFHTIREVHASEFNFLPEKFDKLFYNETTGEITKLHVAIDLSMAAIYLAIPIGLWIYFSGLTRKRKGG